MSVLRGPELLVVGANPDSEQRRHIDNIAKDYGFLPRTFPRARVAYTHFNSSVIKGVLLQPECFEPGSDETKSLDLLTAKAVELSVPLAQLAVRSLAHPRAVAFGVHPHGSETHAQEPLPLTIWLENVSAYKPLPASFIN